MHIYQTDIEDYAWCVELQIPADQIAHAKLIGTIPDPYFQWTQGNEYWFFVGFKTQREAERFVLMQTLIGSSSQYTTHENLLKTCKI